MNGYKADFITHASNVSIKINVESLDNLEKLQDECAYASKLYAKLYTSRMLSIFGERERPNYNIIAKLISFS